MRKFIRAQVVRDLSLAYPEVIRLAWLLTGREDTALSIARNVIRRAVPAWRTWTSEPQQRNWFFHHTLLTTRQSAHRPPAPDTEVLLTAAGPDARDDVEYRAFVRALRDLPFQQAEAFILFDMLGFDVRRSAVTMDLSTTATANHLEAARRSLRSLAPSRYEELLEHARAAALSLSPADYIAIPSVQAAVRRHLWPGRIKLLLLLTLLLGLALLAWRCQSDLVRIFQTLRSSLPIHSAATQP